MIDTSDTSDTPALQEIPYSEEWELPWDEQTLASRAAQAVHMALGMRDEGGKWAGDVLMARRLVDALREVEATLLAGFAEGWSTDRFRMAALRSTDRGR